MTLLRGRFRNPLLNIFGSYLDLLGIGIGIGIGIEIEKSIATPIPIPIPNMILTLGRDQPPLRGPQPIKPPALSQDTYSG